MTTVSALRIASASVFICVASAAPSIPASPQPAQRIVAVGDIHGAADAFAAILQSAGLIDAQRRWVGGRARLVQTGDFLDRGTAVRDVLELLMRLEDEAKRAGGQVHVLFGNHEGMNVLQDLRDVSPDAYQSFADADSESKRARAFTAHAAVAVRSGRGVDKNEWMRAHPPGCVEYLESMGPSGRFGRWLRSLKVAVKLDDSIFMHAGIPIDSSSSLNDINRTVEREVRYFDEAVSALREAGLIAPSYTLQEIVGAGFAELQRLEAMRRMNEPLPAEVMPAYGGRLERLGMINRWTLVAPEGALWYRGYASLPDSVQPQIEALLKRLGAARFVVGHTANLSGRIWQRFGNRVFLIDTGMLSTHYKGGRPSALEIADGHVTAVYVDARETLQTAAISHP